MQLELSRAAQADLDALRDASLADLNLEAATAYLYTVEAALRRLEDFPGIGAIDAGLPPALRSLGGGQHRIFYKIEGQTILIVRVLRQAGEAER